MIMMQTVKFGRVRAQGDPDRTDAHHGTFYGNNLPGVYVPRSWSPRMRVTRGAWLRRISR